MVSVSHPLVDSPSLVGHMSTATLKVLSGSVPAMADAARIDLAFDRHRPLGTCGGIEKGRNLILLFTADGRLFEVK